MGFLLRISAFIDLANRFVGKAVIWLIFAAALVSSGNAIARKVLSLSSNAFLEIQWYLFAAAFMLGAAATFLQNGHIRIDVLAGRLSPRTRILIEVVGITVFLLPLCYFMVTFSWPIVERAYLGGEVSSNAGGLIRWPMYAVLPAGFVLLGLQAISELIKCLAALSGQASHLFMADEEADATDPAAQAALSAGIPASGQRDGSAGARK